MRGAALKLHKEVESLPDVQKIKLVDALLIELDKPDPEIDKVWADESHWRWKAYKAGKVKALSYREVMGRFKVR